MLDTLRKYAYETDAFIEKTLALAGTGRVADAMRYSVNAGGKRIRPALLLGVFDMLSRGAEAADRRPVNCAAALELIHTYSLIHDDLPCMDDDDLRRGKPSCHKQFGEAAAVLAGDALLTLAFELAGEGRLCAVLAKAAGISGMVGGQALDMGLSEEAAFDEETLARMHGMKTGALIAAACECGAISAAACERDISNMREFGADLGLAFQIRDDILDVTGNEKDMGKPTGGDAANRKITFVSLLGLSEAGNRLETFTLRAARRIEGYEKPNFLLWLCEYLLNRGN